jgi:deoxycytidylate deaminase
MTDIKYPYLPPRRTIRYVAIDNEYMRAARDYALAHSLDETMPTGSVVVKDGHIIGQGANGSDYHKTHPCERVRLGSKTGEDYDKCDGCHPRNHSERRAVFDAAQQGYDTNGADLYLWGHWWCCKPCWDSMIEAGVRDVVLLEGSEMLFNKKREAKTT